VVTNTVVRPAAVRISRQLHAAYAKTLRTMEAVYGAGKVRRAEQSEQVRQSCAGLRERERRAEGAAQSTKTVGVRSSALALLQGWRGELTTRGGDHTCALGCQGVHGRVEESLARLKGQLEARAIKATELERSLAADKEAFAAAKSRMAEVTSGYASMESAAMKDAGELRGLADTLQQWPGNAALEQEVRTPCPAERERVCGDSAAALRQPVACLGTSSRACNKHAR
jgi:hypothetical protein